MVAPVRDDDETITCAPNAKHGHPDAPREVNLRFLRFLDCTYAMVNPLGTEGDDPVHDATRITWQAAGGSIAEEDLPEPGCWSYTDVVAIRPLLWGDK